MIQFNDLKFLTPKTLYIDAEVSDLSYYDNVIIESIIIDTESTATSTGPSDNPALVIDVNSKSYNNVIDVTDLVKDKSGILFVYAKASGTPALDTPCGLDIEYTLQIAIDYSYVYDKALKLAKCVSKCSCADGKCAIDTVFANFALQYYRMESAIKLGQWSNAYDAYCYLMHKSGNESFRGGKVKTCSCNE